MIGRLPVDARGQYALHGRRQTQLRERSRHFHCAVAPKCAFVKQRLYDLFDKERIAAGALGNQTLERIEFDTLAEQSRQHRRAVCARQRVKPKLGIAALVGPFVPILWPIVDQQQDAGIGEAVSEKVEQRLGLRIDPVQVLEDYNQRLVQAFSKEDALDRVERALTLDVSVHLRQRVGPSTMPSNPNR